VSVVDMSQRRCSSSGDVERHSSEQGAESLHRARAFFARLQKPAWIKDFLLSQSIASEHDPAHGGARRAAQRRCSTSNYPCPKIFHSFIVSDACATSAAIENERIGEKRFVMALPACRPRRVS
jgi:hypothetical protein